jgi:carotenoid cleavage dioxygenase
MVHGVRLSGGRAEWYRNRFVRGDGDHGPNTNVIGHAGRTWAIVEAGTPPVELAYDISSVGTTDFDGTLPKGFTAHPKRDPQTGELHAVNYSWEWDYIQYVKVSTDGRVNKVVNVPVADGPMVHDTAITETQALLFDLPVTFNLEAAMAGATFPYQWNPDHGARVGLLPMDGGAADVRWCEVELCYVYHPLNAYDLPDGRVVVDVVRHARMFATDKRGPNEGGTTLERWTLDPTAGKVLEERLDDRYQEFPRADERITGRPHRYGYSVNFASALSSGPLLKHDIEAGTTESHDFGPGRGTGEAVFVPRSADAAEDDGWLMSFVYDVNTESSELVILDAQDFSRPPVATVPLPQRVPHGFHGNWLPDGP